MADGITAALVFAVGALVLAPFAVARFVLRTGSAPNTAARLERLSRRLMVLPVVGAIAFLVWIGVTAWSHVLGDLRDEALILLAILWLMVAPLLGLRLLAATLRGPVSGGPRA